MRIISKFQDYYDGCGWVDPTVIWKRNKSEQFPCPKEFVGFSWQNSFNRNDIYYDHIVVVGFCGEIFIGIGGYPKKKYGVSWCSDYSDAEWLWNLNAPRVNKREKRIFNLKPSIFEMRGKDCTDLNIKYKTPIFLIEEQRVFKSGYYTYQKILETSPCLKNYKFYRGVDGYTARQRIEQFVTNELASERQPEVELSDKMRKIKHGMDERSFRKNKPPKRKKNDSA